MGLPVTALMERQAPPRVSPSSLVLGQDDARHAQPLVEGLRDVDGVLAGHRVHGEQDLARLHFLLDIFQLLHERLVDVQAAGGVDDDGVVPHRAGVLDRLLRRLDGALGAFFKHLDARLAAHDLQLVDSGGAVDIPRDQKRLLVLFFEEKGELAAQRRLARALQAAHQDDGGRPVRHFELGVGRTHQRDELLVDDLDDLLGGVEALQDLLPHRLGGDVGDELFGDEDVDVRLQKGDAHLAHGRLDLQLGQPAALGQFGKDVIESLGERGKQCHTAPPSRTMRVNRARPDPCGS